MLSKSFVCIILAIPFVGCRVAPHYAGGQEDQVRAPDTMLKDRARWPADTSTQDDQSLPDYTSNDPEGFRSEVGRPADGVNLNSNGNQNGNSGGDGPMNDQYDSGAVGDRGDYDDWGDNRSVQVDDGSSVSQNDLPPRRYGAQDTRPLNDPSVRDIRPDSQPAASHDDTYQPYSDFEGREKERPVEYAGYQYDAANNINPDVNPGRDNRVRTDRGYERQQGYRDAEGYQHDQEFGPPEVTQARASGGRKDIPSLDWLEPVLITAFAEFDKATASNSELSVDERERRLVKASRNFRIAMKSIQFEDNHHDNWGTKWLGIGATASRDTDLATLVPKINVCKQSKNNKVYRAGGMKVSSTQEHSECSLETRDQFHRILVGIIQKEVGFEQYTRALRDVRMERDEDTLGAAEDNHPEMKSSVMMWRATGMENNQHP